MNDLSKIFVYVIDINQFLNIIDNVVNENKIVDDKIFKFKKKLETKNKCCSYS